MMRFMPKALIRNRFFSGSVTRMVGAVVAMEGSVGVDTSPSVGARVGALTGAGLGLGSTTINVGEGVGSFSLPSSLLGEAIGIIIMLSSVGSGVTSASVGNGVGSGVTSASVGNGVGSRVS